MSHETVQVRELAGWDFDEYKYRPSDSCDCANVLIRKRPHFTQQTARLQPESELHHDALRLHASRAELLEEMQGLDWSLGIVDLRHLLAFQRRLVLNPKAPQRTSPIAADWPGLIDFCFPQVKHVASDSIRKEVNALVFSSENPNLQVRLCADVAKPIQIHCGSPFVEVAQYRERWFLRDGYHRAYTLLRNSVYRVPAVIVQAKTLEELGATQPWFFTEDILHSTHPPHVTDFLDDALTIQYERPAFIKTIRITMEETLAPASIGEQS